MTSLRTGLLAAIALAATLVLTGTGTQAHADDDGYAWQDQNVCLETGAGVSPTWKVARAVRQWNRAQDRITLDAKASCAGSEQSVRVSEYAANDDKGGWMQWTEWEYPYFERGILHLNRLEHRYSSPCRKASLAAHELGHALGLSHVDTRRKDTLMGKWHGSYRYDVSRCGAPGPQDIASVQRTYA